MDAANGSRECAPDEELANPPRDHAEWRRGRWSPQRACRGCFFFTISLARASALFALSIVACAAFLSWMRHALSPDAD